MSALGDDTMAVLDDFNKTTQPNDLATMKWIDIFRIDRNPDSILIQTNETPVTKMAPYNHVTVIAVAQVHDPNNTTQPGSQ